MNPWLLRGAAMVLLHVLVRTALAVALISAPGSATVPRAVALVVLVVVAVLWAGLDAVREDLDDVQRDDLSARWLKAALLTGPVAGLIGWAVQGLFVDASGSAQLLVELTGGAAFTVLLVLVPAVLGILVGHRVRPPAASEPEPVGSVRAARRRGVSS